VQFLDFAYRYAVARSAAGEERASLFLPMAGSGSKKNNLSGSGEFMKFWGDGYILGNSNSPFLWQHLSIYWIFIR
jgi:hypothetical protein